jgi:hypothetical protein
MIPGMFYGENQTGDPDLESSVNGFWTFFEKYFESEITQKQVARRLFDASFDCDRYTIRDVRGGNVWFCFAKTSGGTPKHFIVDAKLALNQETIRSGLHQQTEMKNPFIFGASILSFGSNVETRQYLAERAAASYIEAVLEKESQVRAPVGYEQLQPQLDAFTRDNPIHEKNVFIVMRFRQDKHFLEIRDAIRNALSGYGLKGLRADDRMYPNEGDLWSNICTYMLGCSHAVCVFEDIDERDFNPNVSLEYGFMRALNKPILLLKEKRLPRMPTDIVGKLYRDFDAHNIEPTINRQIIDWCEKDLRLSRIAKS